jgi:aspartyl-tRNA(Asn)/glutamyl-tRNA(Gln) amidotransferase subunit B
MPNQSEPGSAGVLSESTFQFETVIGLEVHCELATRTKLFCGCPNRFGAEPNTNVCPVCLGLPGSLPVLNAKAVELAARIGLALNCQVAYSTFHRKNYFYPDMPKDFQISQYDEPICRAGWLDLPSGRRVGITRAHMEEDTGKSIHRGGSGRILGSEYSLVDYNRAGVPLVEIVSGPDIRSAAEAKEYVGELRSILVAIGASDGKMEEGSLRVDANISLRRIGEDEFGTRCEIKNLNSLRSLGRALEFEAARQAEILEGGGSVQQQTRHFDESAGVTIGMRSKEEADDYRYFPEPDLVPVEPAVAWLEELADSMPKLPAARRAALADLVSSDGRGAAPPEAVAVTVGLGLEEMVMACGQNARIGLNRMANEVASRTEMAGRLNQDDFVLLVGMEASGRLSASQSKVVLVEMLETGGSPDEIVAAKGFEPMSDETLATTVMTVLEGNPAEAARLIEGDKKVTQFLMGQVMKATSGRANARSVMQILAQWAESKRGL